MNDKEREEFWKVLLTARSLNDIEKINSKIIYPEKLYRYRFVDIKNLNALAENKLYFSTSNYYDDPFDTFIRIDIKQIKKIATQCFKHKNFPPDLMKLFDLIPKQNLSEENINHTLNDVINFAKETRTEIRKWHWSLCFTEKYNNEALWLKYGDNHKGFVLEYDIKSLKNATFNAEVSAPCMINNNVSFAFYPMYYSKNENGYDSTNYAGFVTLCYLLEKIGCISLVRELSSKNFMWEMERVLLTKKWIHHYDEEWRMVLNSQYRIENIAKPCIICKPSKIILGLGISENDKKAILMATEKANINSIEQMLINDNDEFVSKKF